MCGFKFSGWLYQTLGANILYSGETKVDTPRQMIDHLQQHRDEGDKVPNHAFRRLADEADDFSMFPEESASSLELRKNLAKSLVRQRRAITKELDENNICRECFIVMPYWSEICHNCKDEEEDG